MDDSGCEKGCVPPRKDWNSVADPNRRLRYQRVMEKEGDLNCWPWDALHRD